MLDVATLAAGSISNNWTGAGSRYNIVTASGVEYLIYIAADADVYFKKRTNGSAWGTPVLIFTGTATNLSVWYDRWSNISADLIHVAYTESGGADTLYRSIDAANSDTLSTQTTIFNGVSRANGGNLSITRTRGGNLYCHTMIDAGVEGGFFRSTDVGANWSSRTVNETLATTDQIIMLPGWAADNQDAMAFFWDASADEISRYLYDDSANTWAETSIATSMVDVVATTSFPHFAGTVDITNSQNLLVAWSGVDTASAKLRCWKVTEAAITEVTNVVSSSTDDQGLCSIGIDTATDDWYVVYFGKTDGSETWADLVRPYYKVSTDEGATWSAETRILVSDANADQTRTLWGTPRFSTHAMVCWQSNTPANIFAASDAPVTSVAGGAHILGGTVVR